VAVKTNSRSKAWGIFDHIVAEAAQKSKPTPWVIDANGKYSFVPDYATLQKLLGVPLHLKATTTSGVPALALDVWMSYEFRRAGFDADQVWPRPTAPRILPPVILKLMKTLPVKMREDLGERIFKGKSIPGVTTASANILGKNYLKQVDVIISDWATGPELLVSTKRMDSSYANNAANRIEESYGDAKNLRLRHPLAALGFAFGVRSDILDSKKTKAPWLFDLLEKLGREDDAYHSTCLVLMDYEGAALPRGKKVVSAAPENREPGAVNSVDEEVLQLSFDALKLIVQKLPDVTIRHDATPEVLSPARFFTTLITRILDITPINLHEEVRLRRSWATATQPSG
jgi:hypothetical protein